MNIYENIKESELKKDSKLCERLLILTNRQTVIKLLIELRSKTFYITKTINNADSRFITIKNVVGWETAKAIYIEFGGEQIHFTRLQVFKKFIQRYIKEHQDETNRKISIALDITENYVSQNRQ